MNTLETDVEVKADGSLKLLSPLPVWLKPGTIQRLLVVSETTLAEKPKRQLPSASAEMIAARAVAFEKLRDLNPYREISDPVAWERMIREDVKQPGRE